MMDILDRLRLKIQRIPAGSYHTCGDACTNTDCLLVGARQKIEELRDALACEMDDTRNTCDALAARLAEAEALRKDAERWRELESVGRQYRFPSIWGGTVWRDSSNDYNGSRYTETREIFARREAIDAAMGEKP